METKLVCWRCGGTDHYAGICPDAMRQSGPVNERGLDAMTCSDELGLAQDPNLAAYQKQQMVRDAAPVLLEACKWAAKGYHHPACKCKGEYAANPERYCNCHVQACRTAIAKAEGRE